MYGVRSVGEENKFYSQEQHEDQDIDSMPARETINTYDIPGRDLRIRLG